MSSALHPAQAHQSGRQQWWSRSSTPKSATLSIYRSTSAEHQSGASTPTTPSSASSRTYDDKSLKGSKGSRKFNTLASVIGFKSKKSHPTINIPSGPVSPPLPVQKPPPQSSPNSSRGPPPSRPPRSARPMTASSTLSSFQYDPKSPAEPSIYSSEDGGPMTPSDQLSRHRTSYQPSLFTFAEQQDRSVAALRLGDNSGSRYSPSDARISVLSDPSVIDPHMLKKEQATRSSHISASSYQSGGKLAVGFLHHRDSFEKRKSAGDSLLSKEIDLTSDADTTSSHRKSPELRPRVDQRHSDVPVPAVPKLSASMLLTAQRASLHKSDDAAVAGKSPGGSRSVSRTGSPVSSTHGHNTTNEDECAGRDRVTSLRNGGSPANDQNGPGAPIRPKAASVSVGSFSGSSAGGRPSPSIVTSFSSATALSRNTSVTSGTGSAAGSMPNAVHRQQSVTRLRSVPPSRNPPPSSNLPPTPQGGPPSPLTFRSPKNLSVSSLLNSGNSTSDDPSLLAFDPPPSTPSSEASSNSLCFASITQTSMLAEVDSGPFPQIHRSRPDTRSTNMGRLPLPQRSATSGLHTAKSSTSSNHTLMGHAAARGDTPVQRSIRKSMSQSSLSAVINGRVAKHRMDSETSITIGNTTPEENPASVLHSMRALRKQRSMHNTRIAGGSLALPPFPQQLRHVSSFNTSSASEASSTRAKCDSLTSPFSSQRRGTESSTPASNAASSLVTTPTTPQTHKKRSIFSSHGKDRDRDRERRDAGLGHEREKHDVGSSEGHHADKKKSHSIGLGIFSGHFSPSSSSSQFPDTQEPLHPPSPRADHVNTQFSSPPSNNNAGDHLDQHILPPKELLSQMEALADMDPPCSPPQFSDRPLDNDTDEDYWEGSSIVTADQESMRSRLNSLSGHSIASSTDENGGIMNGIAGSSAPSLTTRHFANASGSIHGRLQSDRPSSSRLPMRNVSAASGRSRVSTSPGTRPSTADPFIWDSSDRVGGGDNYAPTGLPPPPRRKGAVISSPTNEQVETDEAPDVNPLSLPPRRNTPKGLQRLPSLESQCHSLQRLSSYETISTYNPNRSIFRKPSFLNIEDEMNEQFANETKLPMATVPEDSFLILEHGKDSLDLGRTSDDIEHNTYGST